MGCLQKSQPQNLILWIYRTSNENTFLREFVIPALNSSFILPQTDYWFVNMRKQDLWISLWIYVAHRTEFIYRWLWGSCSKYVVRHRRYWMFTLSGSRSERCWVSNECGVRVSFAYLWFAAIIRGACTFVTLYRCDTLVANELAVNVEARALTWLGRELSGLRRARKNSPSDAHENPLIIHHRYRSVQEGRNHVHVDAPLWNPW